MVFILQNTILRILLRLSIVVYFTLVIAVHHYFIKKVIKIYVKLKSNQINKGIDNLKY